jgi:hypothetical protein
VDLRFDDDRGVGELRKRGLEFSGGFGGDSLGNGNSELLEERLGLILVDVHVEPKECHRTDGDSTKKPKKILGCKSGYVRSCVRLMRWYVPIPCNRMRS